MWGKAAHHAVLLLNITPSRSLGNVTPHEAAYGDVPDVSKLRVSGCAVFATLPHPKKLEDKAVRATNLGHIGYGKFRLLLRGPEYKISSRPPSSSMKKFLAMLLTPPRR
jgi:hypothetical protein